jgi:hypothetical protein
MLVSCLAYSSTLKMEATYYSETYVDFQRATQRYVHSMAVRTPNPTQITQKLI